MLAIIQTDSGRRRGNSAQTLSWVSSFNSQRRIIVHIVQKFNPIYLLFQFYCILRKKSTVFSFFRPSFHIHILMWFNLYHSHTQIRTKTLSFLCRYYIFMTQRPRVNKMRIETSWKFLSPVHVFLTFRFSWIFYNEYVILNVEFSILPRTKRTCRGYFSIFPATHYFK